MTMLRRAIALSLVIGCGEPADPAGAPDAATPTPDAATPGSCGGAGDRFVLAGAAVLDTGSVGPVTVASKIAGVGGPLGTTEFYVFSTRNALTDHLDAAGTHDVATLNLKYLRGPQGADCETAAGGCRGFFALAGTYTVLELQPRYRATFELTELRERTDSTNQPGPAIAGTVTGCIDVTR